MTTFLPTGYYLIVPFVRKDLPVEAHLCATAPASNTQLQAIFNPSARDGVYQWLVTRVEEEKPVYNILGTVLPHSDEVSSSILEGWNVEKDAVILTPGGQKWEISPIIHENKQLYMISVYRDVGVNTQVVEMENTSEKKLRIRTLPVFEPAEAEDSDAGRPVDRWQFIPIPINQE